jgi:hypothetical protein
MADSLTGKCIADVITDVLHHHGVDGSRKFGGLVNGVLVISALL